MRQKSNEEYFNILSRLKQDFVENYNVYLKETMGLDLLSIMEGINRLAATPIEEFGNINESWNEDSRRHGLHNSVAGKVAEVFALLTLGRMARYSSIEDVQDKDNQSNKKVDILIKQDHWRQKYGVQVKACIVGYDGNVKVYTNYFDGESDRLMLIDIERGYYIFGGREELKSFCLDYMKEYNTDEIPVSKFERMSRILNNRISINVSPEIQQLSKKIGV